MEKTLGHSAEAMAVLDQQYQELKNEMLSKSPEDLFESCFRIAAVEDVYFYVTENKIFKPKEKEYILNSGDCVLTDLMQDWYTEILKQTDYIRFISAHYYKTCFQVRNKWMINMCKYYRYL